MPVVFELAWPSFRHIFVGNDVLAIIVFVFAFDDDADTEEAVDDIDIVDPDIGIGSSDGDIDDNAPDGFFVDDTSASRDMIFVNLAVVFLLSSLLLSSVLTS